MSNEMTKGADNYLKTTVETMRLLTDYVPPPRLQPVHDPDGKRLAFVECWHCGRPHFKSECPELKLLDTGVQNLNIDDCSEEHSLFLADDGNGLVQKQAKGVDGIPPYHAYIYTYASYSSTPYPELSLKPEETGSWAHWSQQCGIVRDGLKWFTQRSRTSVV